MLSFAHTAVANGQCHVSLRVEYLVELREYGPVYSSWASAEEELRQPLEGVSSCVANCSTALEMLTEDMSEEFLPVFREYVLYIESMKVRQPAGLL